MKNSLSLTEGKISSQLIKLALPIMATSFFQMAYNMTDMAFIGRLGSDQVAAVGMIAFFTWFGIALLFSTKSGVEVNVAQSIGKKKLDLANRFVTNGVTLAIIASITLSLVFFILRDQLISIFDIKDLNVTQMASSYFAIICIGVPFSLSNPTLSAVYNASGDSKTPFKINAVGLILNIVLDWCLIFGNLGAPKLGIKGAAIATSISQIVVFIILIYNLKVKNSPLDNIKLFGKLESVILKRILKVGLPVSAHSCLFSLFATFLTKIIATWGPMPVAVQAIGSQIEAVSWMTANGFNTALSTFVGQNFGAKKVDRIMKASRLTIQSSVLIGAFASIAFIFFGKHIFGIFMQEADTLAEGIIYMKILGYSQVFMCLEITLSGVFNGVGRPIIPSIIGIVFTGMRIPAAIFLSQIDSLGIHGIWWSISMSSVVKGTVLFIFFIILIKKLKNNVLFNDTEL